MRDGIARSESEGTYTFVSNCQVPLHIGFYHLSFPPAIKRMSVCPQISNRTAARFLNFCQSDSWEMLAQLIFPSLSLNYFVIIFIFLSFSIAVWKNHLIQFSHWLLYSVHLRQDLFSQLKLRLFGNNIFILISSFLQQPVRALPRFFCGRLREISQNSPVMHYLFRTFFSIYHCHFLRSWFSLFSLALLFHAVNFYQIFGDSCLFKCQVVVKF